MNKETIETRTGKTIKIDPGLLVDSVDTVNDMVNANVMLLNSVSKLIKLYIAGGVNPDEAGEIALEFHRRAADKARSMVKYEEEDSNEESETDPDRNSETQ